MTRIAMITGWLLALGAALGAGTLYVELRATQAELEISRQATEAVRLELSQQMAKIDSLNEELTRLKVAQAGGNNKGASSDINVGSLLQGLMGGNNPNAKGDPAALLQGLLGGGEGGNVDPAALLDKLFSGEGEFENSPAAEMMKSVAGMMESEPFQGFMDQMFATEFESSYGELIDTLGLSPEKAEQVRDLYLEHMRSSATDAMAIFGGGADFKSLGENVEAGKEQLRADLSKVLDARQLSLVDAYEEELPVRSMTDVYDMQLRAMARSVDPDARELAAAVLAEEVVASQGEAPDLANHVENERAAHERALARIESEVSPEDYERIKRFIEQQSRMTEWSMNLFGGSKEETAPPTSE